MGGCRWLWLLLPLVMVLGEQQWTPQVTLPENRLFGFSSPAASSTQGLCAAPMTDPRFCGSSKSCLCEGFPHPQGFCHCERRTQIPVLPRNSSFFLYAMLPDGVILDQLMNIPTVECPSLQYPSEGACVPAIILSTLTSPVHVSFSLGAPATLLTTVSAQQWPRLSSLTVTVSLDRLPSSPWSLVGTFGVPPQDNVGFFQEAKINFTITTESYSVTWPNPRPGSYWIYLTNGLDGSTNGPPPSVDGTVTLSHGAPTAISPAAWQVGSIKAITSGNVSYFVAELDADIGYEIFCGQGSSGFVALRLNWFAEIDETGQGVAPMLNYSYMDGLIELGLVRGQSRQAYISLLGYSSQECVLRSVVLEAYVPFPSFVIRIVIMVSSLLVFLAVGTTLFCCRRHKLLGVDRPKSYLLVGEGGELGGEEEGEDASNEI